jgi:hypothetical protein
VEDDCCRIRTNGRNLSKYLEKHYEEGGLSNSFLEEELGSNIEVVLRWKSSSEIREEF